MMSSRCAMEGIYDMICRDPDTATGGVDPSETNYHGEGFYREDRVRLDNLEGSSIDRKVSIRYDGTIEHDKISNGNKRGRRFGVTIRVGYYAGDHHNLTHMIANDDELLIIKRLRLQQYWPSDCCVQGYIPQESTFQDIDGDRYILEIAVEVYVYD